MEAVAVRTKKWRVGAPLVRAAIEPEKTALASSAVRVNGVTMVWTGVPPLSHDQIERFTEPVSGALTSETMWMA